MSTPRYTVRRAVAAPEGLGLWDGRAWGEAPILAVASFHPHGSDHRPVTDVKLLHDDASVHALYRVRDRYVRSVHTAYESDTHKDSCVELFVQPARAAGYFAFEMNCGGALSLRYIENPTRTANRFAKWTPVAEELARQVKIAHSMPPVVDPEIEAPTDWWLEMSCPAIVLEHYCGVIGPLAGQAWRGNCFKCGDDTSHPHWASWAPIGEALNFHQPQCFGMLTFDK